MTTRKKIVFEGQDIGLSSTMQKLQRQAEQMSSSIFEGQSKTLRSSKELNDALNLEISSRDRLSRIANSDKRAKIAEDYSKKLDEISRKEQAMAENLRRKGLSDEDIDKRISEQFGEQRSAADVVYKDSLNNVKKLSEEQKTTNLILRELVDQQKLQWEQEITQDRRGVEKFLQQANYDIDSLSPEERMKVRYQEALLSEQSKETGNVRSVLTDIIGAGLIRDLGGIFGQMPNARDAFDLIPGLARMGGAGIGAAGGAGIGAIAGSLSLTPDPGKGAIQGAALGAEFGQRAGEIAGNALARHFEERENLDRSSLRFSASGGFGMGGSYSRYGTTMSEAFQIAQEMIRSSGTGGADVSSLLGAEAGFGLDRGSLMGLVRGTRRTGGDFGSEISNLLGIAESQGIDRVLFSDLIENQNNLIQTLGAMVDTVDPKNTAAIIMELNSLGGGFSLRDPRSSGFAQSLQSGLTNTNDFGRSMNLSILRRMSPNASLLDLLEMEEQGMGGERGREFLRETVGQYSQMFGDNEDLAVLSLRSRFPGIPISDLRRLVRGQDVIGSLENEDLGVTTNVTDSGFVSRRAVMSAEITDAFAIGAIEGMTRINDQMADLFRIAFERAMSDVSLEDSIQAAIGGNRQSREKANRQIMNIRPGFHAPN